MEYFRISAALKNIIGKDLITDDFIAVFELVKNSFDAGARRVDLYFENKGKGGAKIIVSDDGCGMSKADILGKYLFVAYSDKKSMVAADYRNKIAARRAQAGAKGIGRFSCDRLGSSLKLYSKQAGKVRWNRTVINWLDFEQDMQQEFSRIPVEIGTSPAAPHGRKHGTVLEIGQLRGEWGREKLLALKRSLEKLVNPNQGNDAGGFAVFLHAPQERAEDRKIPNSEPWKVVNGRIANFIFEALSLKTTSITSQISEDGQYIITRLKDRGRLVYEIKEENSYRTDGGTPLHSISVYLFALNQAAKTTFTKHMGVRPVAFGSVFLYKNGFRIHPFGDEADDSLGVSRRKQQGTSRYLGTRDLIGRIEIDGKNAEFQETSSRDGGLIRNESFGLLQDFFWEILRRLEKFVIGVIKWGNTGEIEDWKSLSASELRAKCADLIIGLSGAKGIIDIRYDAEFLDVINDVSEKSLKRVLRNFRKIADKSSNKNLSKEVTRAERRLEELQEAAQEAEAEAEVEREGRRDAEAEARRAEEEALEARREAEESRKESRQKTTENVFLRAVVSSDISNILSLHHHIGIAAGTIENHVKNLYRRLRSDKPTTTDMILDALQKISFQAKQIDSVSKFATKANFNAAAAATNGDVLAYIREYALNVCAGMFMTKDNKDYIEIDWRGPEEAGWEMTYRPLEVALVVDNLISNARKAGATSIHMISTVPREGEVRLRVEDNGSGMGDVKAEELFRLGYSTTNGSGLGLFHVKNVLEGIGGAVSLSQAEGGGSVAELVFRHAD